MVFTARVYNVLIASPSDTAALRRVVEAVIQSWNRDRAENAHTILRSLRWEFDSVPTLGQDAQLVLNEQLVAKADIVVGLFHARLGTATERSPSGTAEEIDEAAKAGKRVHVYFSDMPVARDHDKEQLAALDEFKAELSKRGLMGSFASEDDLTAQVRRALEDDFLALAGIEAPGLSRLGGHAHLRADYTSDREQKTDSRGKTTTRTVRQRLNVYNDGTVKAQDVRVELISRSDSLRPPEFIEAHEADIVPGGRFSIPVMTGSGTASVVDAKLTWREGDEELTDTQTVSFYS